MSTDANRPSPDNDQPGTEDPTGPTGPVAGALPAGETDRSPRRTLLIYLAVALVVLGATVGLSRALHADVGIDRVIVIPAGTAERIAAGEAVELIPADLRFQLRDRLVVVNNDSATHVVGPFTVAAGQQLTKRFSEAATIEGSCSLHPGGTITIEIGGS